MWNILFLFCTLHYIHVHFTVYYIILHCIITVKKCFAQVYYFSLSKIPCLMWNMLFLCKILEWSLFFIWLYSVLFINGQHIWKTCSKMLPWLNLIIFYSNHDEWNMTQHFSKLNKDLNGQTIFFMSCWQLDECCKRLLLTTAADNTLMISKT